MNDDDEVRPISRVEEKWSSSAEVYAIGGFKVFWEALEVASAYQMEAAFGNTPWLESIMSRISDPAEGRGLRALSLGCSNGETAPANEFARTGRFREVTVVDISQDLLASQKEITDRLGLGEILRYRRMDLEQDSLNLESRFDLIFAVGTLHHIRGLERLFAEINENLTPSGLFFMREYVGPDRLQFTDRQIEIANAVRRALPERLCTDLEGQLSRDAWRPSLEEVVADDPSEAIRSSELLAVAERFLAVEEVRMTGGSLLDPLLHGIAGHFEDDATGDEILPLLIAFEKILIRERVLPSDYVLMTARRRKADEPGWSLPTWWRRILGAES